MNVNSVAPDQGGIHERTKICLFITLEDKTNMWMLTLWHLSKGGIHEWTETTFERLERIKSHYLYQQSAPSFLIIQS